MKAALVALATDRQCSSISSTMTSLVSSMPSATMARLSPTRTMSTPAASATCAEGKSCAVMTAMGSSRRCIARSVPSVTFFRLLLPAPAPPSGECELYLACGGVWYGDGRGLLAAAAAAAAVAREGVRLVASEDAHVRRAVGR